MTAPNHEPSARMRVNRKKSVISFYERQSLQGSRDPVRSLLDLRTHNHPIDHERPLWVVGILSYRQSLAVQFGLPPPGFEATPWVDCQRKESGVTAPENDDQTELDWPLLGHTVPN